MSRPAFDSRIRVPLGGKHWRLAAASFRMGVDPVTMRPRVARGIIAIGNIAVGGVAIAGVALGIISLGGMSVGLALALGGAAVGLGLSAGGVAIGSVALGGLAAAHVRWRCNHAHLRPEEARECIQPAR
jgi:hypothetical protein